MKYIVPEYYKHFKCKCGECRHPCCEGWEVKISIKEYYRLLGIQCSDKLRSRLDCALKICREPSNEGYAQISADWCGICMLHREDGLCALQAELGDSGLPEVCRLYPRNTEQLTKIGKCSCSNSCERVIELLMDLKEPLQFETEDLSVKPEFEVNLPSQKYDYCKKSISMIKDRSFPLPERLIDLGNYLNGTSIYSKRSDNLSLAFQALYLFEKYFESSISICDYCASSDQYFDISGKEKLSTEDLNMIALKYMNASKHLEAILPDWQILLEQLLINDMFYNNFPYTDNMENVNDAFLSLVITYSFLRINILGYMYDKNSLDELVDLLAAMFRLIEHSDFRYFAVSLFHEENYQAKDCVPQLIWI